MKTKVWRTLVRFRAYANTRRGELVIVRALSVLGCALVVVGLLLIIGCVL